MVKVTFPKEMSPFFVFAGGGAAGNTPGFGRFTATVPIWHIFYSAVLAKTGKLQILY